MMALSTLSYIYKVNVIDAVSNDIVRTADGWYFAHEHNQLSGPFDSSREAENGFERHVSGEA